MIHATQDAIPPRSVPRDQMQETIPTPQPPSVTRTASRGPQSSPPSPRTAVLALSGLLLAVLAGFVTARVSFQNLKHGMEAKTRELEAELTRREQAEKALRTRETHLKNVLINADAVVFTLSPDGRIIHIEGNALERIGLSPGMLAGRLLSETFGDNPELMDNLDKCRSGHSVRYTTRFGSVHAAIMASPVADAAGRVVEVWGVATDITRLAMARLRLAASEERLERVLDAVSDGFFDWDLATDTAYLSRGWQNTFGLPPGQCRDIADAWIDRLHPEDKARVLTHLEKGCATDEVIEDEYRIVSTTGHVRWIRDRGRVVARDASGKARRLVGTVTDVTERKETEHRYRALFETARDAIAILRNGRFVDCNPWSTALTGYSREELLGRRPEHFSPTMQPDGRSSAEAHDRVLEQAAREPAFFEWAIRHKKGHLVHLEVSLVPTPTTEGVLHLAVARDMTERKNLQEVMVRTEKMTSLGSLAAGMAHEINNPLSIILQSAQGTMRRLDPAFAPNAEAAARHGVDLAGVRAYMEERHILRYLEGIREAGERAAAIVHGMLGFSRRGGLAREPAHVGDLIADSLTLASGEYDPKNRYDFRHIAVTRDIPPDLPPISCVATQIKQVLLNLLRNAAQAQCEAGVDRPAISLRARRDAGQMVIEVADNGPGIPPQRMGRVFEPFYTTKRPGEGTGLGLAVSYYIVVRHHGGSLEAAPGPEGGTVFTIRLPLDPPPLPMA